MSQLDGRKWAHLFDDEWDVDALHAFAARIGLKRSWCQRSRMGFPHYDVRATKIAAAIAAGARQVDREFVVSVLQMPALGREGEE